jgi:hypothetical protein
MLKFDTPDVLELYPPALPILLRLKAIDFLDNTPETLELPEGPDSTLLPEPGLFI